MESLSITTFIVGCMLFTIGSVLKTQIIENIICLFDEDVYDRDKVSKYVGTIFLGSGAIIIFLGCVGYLIKYYIETVMFFQIIIMVFCILKSVMIMDKKCRK